MYQNHKERGKKHKGGKGQGRTIGHKDEEMVIKYTTFYQGRLDTHWLQHPLMGGHLPPLWTSLKEAIYLCVRVDSFNHYLSWNCIICNFCSLFLPRPLYSIYLVFHPRGLHVFEESNQCYQLTKVFLLPGWSPFKKFLSGAPGWLSWLSVRLGFGPGHDLTVSLSPASGSVLTIQKLLGILSLCPSCILPLSLPR